MKIKYAHLQHLDREIFKGMYAAIDRTDGFETVQDIIDMYERRDIPRAESVRDINKRFRWDMFRLGGLTSWTCDTLYPYLNDDHIDTALRHVFRGIEIH
jgi:hypothetical protein